MRKKIRSKSQRRRNSQRRRAKRLFRVILKAWIPTLTANVVDYESAVFRLFNECTDNTPGPDWIWIDGVMIRKKGS